MARRKAQPQAPRKRPGPGGGVGAGDVAKRSSWIWAGVGLLGMGLCLLLAGILALPGPGTDNRPAALRVRAETAAQAGRWEEAQALWKRVNQAPGATADSYRAEARASLGLGRAGQAEAALVKASELDPTRPDPWLMRLEIARMEDRPLEALAISQAAWAVVPPASHRAIAQAVTLALLAGTPEELARETLTRWIHADPADLDARAALERIRILNTEPSDPPLDVRISQLEELLSRHPEHTGLREALLLSLAEQGNYERGRTVLEAWPETGKDARYERLAGRWDLDYNEQPALAVDHFRNALRDLPFDWKTHYRLARALQAIGQTEAARRAAVELGRIRERLDPTRLGRQLEETLGRLDEPASRRSLAELCASVGLDQLAEFWRNDTGRPAAPESVDPLMKDRPFRLPSVTPARR